MTNEQEEVLDIEDTVETVDDDGTDTTDWKAEALKAQGIAKRFKTKAEKQKIESKVEAKVEKALEAKGLDRLDKAILRVEKITAEDEVGLVEDTMKESGRTLERVLEMKSFQSDLKEMRDAKATKDATPSGTKRSGATPKDDVEYWLAKGEEGIKELSSTGQREMLQKVVNAKMTKAKNVNSFTDDPVA